MSNLKILRSAFGKVGQTYYIQPCPNPRTGRYPDCVRLVKGDPNKGHTEMILSEDDIRRMSEGTAHFVPADKVFEIVDGTTFNLDDPVDKANWEAIEHCSWIAKDRFYRDPATGELVVDGGVKRYGSADLYVEVPGELTKIKVTKKQLIHKASSYIYEDSERERIKKCKVLGRDFSAGVPPADIIDFLIEKAEKDPNHIIQLYEGEDWKIHLFILDAVDKGVIRKIAGQYKYDDNVLGGTIEAVILLFKDLRYKKLTDSIKRETYPNLLPAAEFNNKNDELLNSYNEIYTQNLNQELDVNQCKQEVETLTTASLLSKPRTSKK